MYLRLTSISNDNSLKTIDLNIHHIVYCAEDEILSIYDNDLCIYDIDLSLLYYFAIIDNEDAGVNYTCYNNLDLGFSDLGFKEVEKYNI